MPLTEEEQFRKFGCGCRALLKLCELKGVSITKEELIERFRSRFGSRWDAQLGITYTSDLIDMARDLGVCRVADTHVSVEYVRDRLRREDVDGIFLITDGWPNDLGEIVTPFYHCVLLLQIDQKRLEVHISDEVGTSELPLGLLPLLGAHFLVLG